MFRVLHLIDSGGLYGAEVMLLTLTQEQQRMGLYPVIGSIGNIGIDEKTLEREAKKAGVPVKKIRMRPGFNIKGIYEILTYRESEGFDLIHSHGYKGDILLGFLPATFRKVPVVTTLHGWTSVSGISKMRLYEWLDARALSFLDAVVVVNKNMVDHPRFPNLPPEKLFVIDNGIPEKDYTNIPLDQDIVKFCQNSFVIGAIGRLSKEKGFKFLLSAIHILLRKGVQAKIVMIGDGQCKEGLKTQAERLGISNHVLFAGYRKNAGAYMNLFNVYAISSLTEGLPITLLEAMRAKVPVVATAVGGIPDVLTHGRDVLLIPPKDPNFFAESIAEIVQYPKSAAERARNAYEKYVQKYSSQKMTKSYLELYNHICERMFMAEGDE